MYGEIYFHNYCIDRTGENAVLSIRKRDYTGASTEVDAGVIPFRKTLLNNSEDRIGGVYPTSATIHLIGSPTFGMDSLHTADDSEYQVVHLIEGQVDWIGYLVPENFSEQEDNEYPTLELKAIDGLTKLKDLKFVSPSGQNYGVADGVFDKTLLFYITEALKKTGLDLDVLTLADRASVTRSNPTTPITTIINGNPFYSTQFNAPYADGKIAVGGYVELEFEDEGKFVSEIIALDDSHIGDGGGLGVTINPPPPVYAGTYTMTFFTATATAGDVLTQATVDARMWVDPDAKIVTDKSELPFPYYHYIDGTYDAWYVLDSIAKLFDMKVTQQQGMWVVETLDKQYVSSDYYRYNKDGVYIDRQPRRAVKVFDCDSVTDLRLAGNVKFIDKTLKRVTVNYPYRYKAEGDPLRNYILNGDFVLPTTGQGPPSTFTPDYWQRFLTGDPLPLNLTRTTSPDVDGIFLLMGSATGLFDTSNRLRPTEPMAVSSGDKPTLSWKHSIWEYRPFPAVYYYNTLVITLKTYTGNTYYLVNFKETEGWTDLNYTSGKPQGQWLKEDNNSTVWHFTSNYATGRNPQPLGAWSDISEVFLTMGEIPEDGVVTVDFVGVTRSYIPGQDDFVYNLFLRHSYVPQDDLVDGNIVYGPVKLGETRGITFRESSPRIPLQVRIGEVSLSRIVNADFGRTVSYTNNGNYYDALTVEVPLGDEDNTDHLSVIKIGGQVNSLWTDISGTLGVGTIGMMLAKTLMRRYLSPSYGVDGGLISHGLQFLDILDLYDEGSLFGIKNGDLRIKESVFNGTLEEYRINPTPENGFDGGANSLRRESGSGSSRGGGGSTGGSVPPSIAPQSLQSVTEVGNTTTLDISARGLRVSDFLVVPNNAPDEDDIITGESYMWLGDGATAGIPDAGTLVGLSDVNVTSPTNGQALVWNSSALKWENATVASGGGTWGSITGVLSNQTDLQAALNGKANLVHTHAASDIVSGVLNIARIPTGTTAGTVALGNDSRINNGQTAYSWGNHAGLYLPLNTSRPAVNLDNHRVSGVVGGGNNTTNIPSGAYSYSPYMTLQSSGDRYVQLWFDSYGGSNIYYRGGSNTTWYDWVSLYHSGNLRSNAQNDARYMQVTAPANGITTGDIANWNTAYSQRHTHTNKALLDVINQSLATTSSVQFSGANISDSLRIPTVAPVTPLNGNLWLGDGATAGVPDAGTLVGLSDVNITSPTNGQSLVWNATTLKWENATVASGGGTWGSITGVLSNQTDLQAALNGKQNVLVSGTNIKTINGQSVLGSGNIVTPNTTYTATNGISISGSNVISPVYGTTSGTVAQGNDARINNGQTAFGWGNHADRGYLRYATGIPTGADLDDYLSTGVYSINSATASSVLNKPTDLGQTATLEVIYSGTYVVQKYFVSSGAHTNYTWFRTRNSGGWNPWVELYHSGNLRSNAQNDARYMQVTAPANAITTGDITNWNTAYSQRHTHANKAFLDTINQNMGTANTVTFAGIIATTRLRIPTSAPSSPANGEIWIDTSS